MTMHIRARAIVSPQAMCGFKLVMFTDPDPAHITTNLLGLEWNGYDRHQQIWLEGYRKADPCHINRIGMIGVIESCGRNGVLHGVKEVMCTPVDPVIKEFITAQGELTLALADKNEPYAASCFYAWDEEGSAFVFKSERHTRHVEIGLHNAKVAGTVVERDRLPGIIKGIQFTGTLYEAEGERKEDARRVYYGKYPFARAFNGELWIIEPNWIKMTDNTPLLGGKKIWKNIAYGI